jgi:DNA repair exonuclease SbcCD nuclease subunit
MITYLGNHDSYWKNTLEINSPNLLLGDYLDTEESNITLITKPKTLLGIDFFPWICDDNEQETKDLIKNSKSQIAFGHFELTGFEMDAGFPCSHGMNRDELKKYDMVISGHFHHRSSDGHIFYVGAPYEMSWADYDDPKGFHIFDTDTRLLEFVPNPHKMHYKITYNDNMEDVDYTQYKGKYVKVIVEKKNDPIKFDRFISDFYKNEPADLNVVEDFTNYTIPSEEEIINQGDSTHVLMDKYVDAVDMSLDKIKMKSVMRDIYNKAQNDKF